MSSCDLCLKTIKTKCNHCGNVDYGPIISKLTISKRKPALIRKETIILCNDCEKEIWDTISKCKDKSK